LKISTIYLFAILSFPFFAQGQKYVVAAERNGVLIESRKIEGYSTKEIRSTMTCNSTPEKFFKVLFNFGNYSTWVPYFDQVKVIRKFSDSEYLYQLAIDPPIIQKRDMVTRLIKKPLGNNGWIVEIKSNNDALPLDPKYIRMQRFVGIWIVRKISDSQIHVQFTNAYDISGSIPGFLMNLAGSKAPLETFENLKSKLEN
jgi:ribosome-associated toxin RatA of RatAB toxin-antitoxin module